MGTIGETVGRGKNRGFGITYIHYCIKYMINESLLDSTGKSTQQFIIIYMGKKDGYITCITDSLCCIPETNTTL